MLCKDKDTATELIGILCQSECLQKGITFKSLKMISSYLPWNKSPVSKSQETANFLNRNYRAVGIHFNVYLNPTHFGMFQLVSHSSEQNCLYAKVKLYVAKVHTDLPDLYIGKKHLNYQVEQDFSRWICLAEPFGGIK